MFNLNEFESFALFESLRISFVVEKCSGEVCSLGKLKLSRLRMEAVENILHVVTWERSILSFELKFEQKASNHSLNKKLRFKV
jgi:hypothetical protein